MFNDIFIGITNYQRKYFGLSKAFTLSLPFLLTFTLALPTNAHEADSPQSIEQFTPNKISDHIYVVHGPQLLPDKNTRAFMNNPGFVLTDKGVVVIDPGSSVQIGRELLIKIKSITNMPVVAVFNTHVHGDHWLGNQAIHETYPNARIYAHERMIERVAAGEGDNWIKVFNSMTDNAVSGTKAVSPNHGLKGGETLDIGNIKFNIHHTGKAHTDHDIMIEIGNDKTIFLGDIVTNKRVPSSDVPHDAYYKGQIEAIQYILKLPLQIYVPGHGITGDRNLPESSLAFLGILYGSVGKNFNNGLNDFEMKDQVITDLKDYQDWNNFEEIGRVISHVYLEIEQASF
ncbi:MAG: MBL fold metallo-hydrolase [Gammaproteobacteria bacterium]|jgi:glyoxylase-like metal-dependent hydrolase (beta-lactamase superfamily II)